MAIADSCYGSELGDDFFTALRGLYKASGITPVELDNNRYENLCCGFATGIRNNWDHNAAGKEGLPKFKQIMRTGAKHVGGELSRLLGRHLPDSQSFKRGNKNPFCG